MLACHPLSRAQQPACSEHTGQPKNIPRHVQRWRQRPMKQAQGTAHPRAAPHAPLLRGVHAVADDLRLLQVGSTVKHLYRVASALRHSAGGRRGHTQPRPRPQRSRRSSGSSGSSDSRARCPVLKHFVSPPRSIERLGSVHSRQCPSVLVGPLRPPLRQQPAAERPVMARCCAWQPPQQLQHPPP